MMGKRKYKNKAHKSWKYKAPKWKSIDEEGDASYFRRREMKAIDKMEKNR